MAVPWIAFLENLKDEAETLSKEELKGLILSGLADGDEFIRKQSEKIERCMNQLARGQVTRTEFENYIVDIEDLTRLQELKLQVEAKARAQRLGNGIRDLILDKMLKLIP